MSSPSSAVKSESAAGACAADCCPAGAGCADAPAASTREAPASSRREGQNARTRIDHRRIEIQVAGEMWSGSVLGARCWVLASPLQRPKRKRRRASENLRYRYGLECLLAHPRDATSTPASLRARKLRCDERGGEDERRVGKITPGARRIATDDRRVRRAEQ